MCCSDGLQLPRYILHGRFEAAAMSQVNTQIIEELIQEQNLESEDVFCAERGCFQVTDISAGKTECPPHAHSSFSTLATDD